MTKRAAVVAERIERKIFLVRGRKVMFDEDLAAIYGVTTKRLNEQVTRNSGRFPEGFCFRLGFEERRNLKSQNATSSWGGRRSAPRAFTEHGAVMLAAVLNSPTAIEASIQVVRAFVKLRALLSTHKRLACKLAELERKISDHDGKFESVFEAIRGLMERTENGDGRRIGFQKPDG